VWLVDGVKHNLLSISQFCDNGYDVLFVKNNCTVINTDDQSIVFKGKRRNNVYKINFSELTDQKVLFLLSMSDKKWLWHRRLGHANWRLISKLSKLQLARGLQDIDYHSDALCGACQKGKIVKTSFKLKDIFLPPDPWNYSTLTYLDQIALHPYMRVNMDWLYLMTTTDGVGLSFLNLKMTHMMCLANSAFKSNLKKS